MNKNFSILIYFISTFLILNSFPGKIHADEVVIISNPRTPALKMRIVFNEELSIGEVEGDENYMFGSNIGFNTDDEGNFYVADYDNTRILKYDPEGKYLLSFGREGQGPGEFQNLTVPRFDKDNNLYIADTTNRRISFFDRDGNYLRQITVKERYIDPFVNSKGFIVTNKWEMNQQGNVQKRIFCYGLFNDKFELLAELFKDEYEFQMPTGTDESSLVNYLAKGWSQEVFRPRVRMLLADDDFIYLGWPEKFEINVYSPEGRLVKKIARDYDPLPVGEKDKEEYFKRLGEGLSSSPQFNEDMIEKVFQKMKFPKFKPAYQSFSLMDNGWLAVIVESVEGEYTLFDIFDRDGKYIAHFKTPVFDDGMFSSLLFFNNNKAYCVAIEDDYRFAKRYSYKIQEYKNNKWIKMK